MSSIAHPSMASDQSFCLSDFLVPPRTNYDDLSSPVIQELTWWPAKSRYLDLSSHRVKALLSNQRISQELYSRVRGGIVVDVGGGAGHFSSVAAAAGASVYINVDLCPNGQGRWGNIYYPDGFTLESKTISHNTQILTVRAEMLDFLSRVPGDSCHIFINGIGEGLASFEDFQKALVKEITHVVPRGGVLCGYDSYSLLMLKQNKTAYEEIVGEEELCFLTSCKAQNPAPSCGLP